jgi:hypothetical protein
LIDIIAHKLCVRRRSMEAKGDITRTFFSIHYHGQSTSHLHVVEKDKVSKYSERDGASEKEYQVDVGIQEVETSLFYKLR